MTRGRGGRKRRVSQGGEVESEGSKSARALSSRRGEDKRRQKEAVHTTSVHAYQRSPSGFCSIPRTRHPRER